MQRKADPGPPPAPRASLKVKLLALAVSLVVALVAAEAGLRIYAQATERERVMAHDPVLGWRLRPGVARRYDSEERPYRIRISEHGLRDRDYPYAKPAGVRRIVVMGDSFVFGSGGVEREERFTELLEAALDETEVINLGIPGFSTDQEYLYLRDEGLRYEADLVVLCMFVNDYERTFLPWDRSIGRPKGYLRPGESGLAFEPPEIPWLYALSDRCYLLGLLDHKFGIARRPAREIPRQSDLPEADKRRLFATLLAAMRDLCRAAGAEFLAVYIPHRGQKEPFVIQEIAAGLDGLRFLDVARTEPFRDPESARALYFEVDSHLNPEGHRALARILEDYFAFGR